MVTAALVLDSGALGDLGNPAVRALLAEAVKRGATVVVHPTVLAQVSGGRGANPRVDAFMKTRVRPWFMGYREARSVGALRRIRGGNDLVVACVALLAIHFGPALIATSDAGDLMSLVGDERGIEVVAV